MNRITAALFLLLVSGFCWTFGQTCERKCGETLDSCSCHPTCNSLGNCCLDFRQYCVEMSPYSGTIMGGTDFTIKDAVFPANSTVVCRFNQETNTEGYVDTSGSGHCISPLLYQTGWLSVEVSSDNGATFNREGAWLSVHTGKLDAIFKAALVNSTKWQYYGTPGFNGSLEMTWDPLLVNAERVNLELWGYAETGDPYTDSWAGEWKYLYMLEKDQPNDGNFNFVPKPAAGNFSQWELGAIRVSSSNHSDGALNVEAVWTEDHALAWHLEEAFRLDSAEWALNKCLVWDELETQLPGFTEEIIDCPCTLAQARADTGRFHTDYGCDMEKGSVCTYHPGSIHCVRAIQASPTRGAGQQCCYDHAGAQVLTSDSIGGSTPDRGHDWGSPPFRKPPRVPGQSHWVYDVLSFYYCCLWSDNCNYYFKHRPSSDCRRYTPPSSAVVFGDPHFITFDGMQYSFNGKGEYTLVMSAKENLTIQGRTAPVNSSNMTLNATKLTSTVMQEKQSDVIEVRLVGTSGLEVLQNQQALNFSEQSWMDMNSVFVFCPTPDNVTVMFPSGAGVEVRRRGETMTTTVLLPGSFASETRGLLGMMNNNINDDLTFSDGQVVKNSSDPLEVFSFGASWAISNASALFTYDSKGLLDTYYHAQRHDTSFLPVFPIPEDPNDPLANSASTICAGEGSDFCRYDVLVGRSPALGNATKLTFQSHMSLMQDLKTVVSCGSLSPPDNGKKVGTWYLEGDRVRFSCNNNYQLQGSSVRVCQSSGQWSGEEAKCVVPSNLPGIITGTVVGAAALVVIIVTLVLLTKKQKKRRSAV
ncbi:sushi domain-containing protein 2 [Nelusetta ayraudi]|uniref:sushi domain-containing protein 2 n=1 Tax=Nelusetta ayraudi TaxID=303726 RepID=UPI003F704D1A